MKTDPSRIAGRAFTLVELLAVIGILTLLVLLLMPAMDNRPTTATIIDCHNNLRQIGVSFSMFAEDNNGRFPPQVSITNYGSMELIGSNSPALHFRNLSIYLGGSWSMWHCPADESKQTLTNKSALTDRNLSYFVSVDATPTLTNAIHAGDRNLEVAGKPVGPGLFTLTTNAAVGWTGELHKFRRNGIRVGCGNLLFVDGHAQRFQADLPIAVQHQGLAANRLAVP